MAMMSSAVAPPPAPPPPSQLSCRSISSSSSPTKRKIDQAAQTLVVAKKARGSFRSFEDARTYVRELGLKSKKEWEAWSKSGARPHDISCDPVGRYASSGWLSYGDFLGYMGTVAGAFRSFEDAREYMRTLGLKSEKEWRAWRKSGARPHDIPSSPDKTYASSGWTSYRDFLGYAEGQGARGSFRSFEDARAYVHTLGLKSWKDWQAWSKSGKRPHDIPSHPDATYASSGWLSLGDFLGFAEGQGARGLFRSFEDARVYVHTLGLKSKKEWRAWSKSGKRPHDIPSHPDATYASSGWTSYGDFLGYAEGKKAQVRNHTDFRSFEDARTYVRELGLKSKKEWETWRKSGARPHDIPSHPETKYASSGWTSYGDFLGFAVGKSAVSTGSACIELIALPRSLKRELDDITLPQISHRFIVFDTPMLEMRYAAMYVAQMLREDGFKGVNDGDIELRLLSGDVVSLIEQTIRDVLALSASGTSASASHEGCIPLLKVHYRHN
ncbi:methyltransferase domain-containing protein [Pycnococcus provasolii]